MTPLSALLPASEPGDHILSAAFPWIPLEIQRLDFLAVCIGLGAVSSASPSSSLMTFIWLAQVVFTLALVHAGVDLIVKVALDIHDLALLPQQGQQLFKAA